MNGLHKVRFVTHGTEMHVFLDDQEVRGCTAANFDYQIDALPVVKLELVATDVEVEAEQADVWKVSEEPIESLNLTVGTINLLHKGIWYNKNGERRIDPVMTVKKLLDEYNGGRLMKYKGLGAVRYAEIYRALEKRELV